jgi:hypothetical protein
MQKYWTISGRLQICPDKWLETYVQDNNIVDIQEKFKELPDEDTVNDGSNDEDGRKQPPELPGQSNDMEDRKQTPEFLGDTAPSFDAEEDNTKQPLPSCLLIQYLHVSCHLSTVQLHCCQHQNVSRVCHHLAQTLQ